MRRHLFLIAAMLGLMIGTAEARPARWCGWYLSQHVFGQNIRPLWLARNWAHVGVNAGHPAVGAIVVWRGHVGQITGYNGRDWIVLSGNDGGRVRERPRSLRGAIAFRFINYHMAAR